VGVAATLAIALGGCALEAPTATTPDETTGTSSLALCTLNPTTIYTGPTGSKPIRGIVSASDGNVYVSQANDYIVQIPPGGCPSIGCNQWYTYVNTSTDPKIGAIIAGPNNDLWFLEPGINSIGQLNPSNGQVFTPVSTRDTGGVPTSLAAGPDGNVWFTWQSNSPNLNVGYVGIVSPYSGVLQNIALTGYGGYPTSITEGPDGTMWFTDSNMIGQIYCSTSSGQKLPVNFSNSGQCTLKLAPPIKVSSAGSILAGPDGNLWFTSGSNVITMSTAGVVQTTYATGGANYLGYGSDGNMWFSDGEIEWRNGAVDSYANLVPSLYNAEQVITGPDANMWVVGTNTFGNSIVSVVTPCGTCRTAQSATAVTIAQGGYPAGIASDGTNVYWTNDWGGGSIETVPRGLGNATTYVPSRAGSYGIAVDSNNVYWTEDNGGNGQVVMKSKSSATLTVLATGQGAPRGIAVGGGNVFWTNNTGGQVQEVAAQAGGAVTTLAQSQPGPFGIVYSGGQVYWANTGTPGQSNGSIMVWNGSGSAGTFASGQNGATDVAVGEAGDSLIWTDASAGTVDASYLSFRAVTIGVPPNTHTFYEPYFTSPAVVSNTPGAYDIVIDPNTGVTYFTDFQNTVWYTSGGQTCPLSTGETTPEAIFVDDTYVYWTNYAGSGTIRRARKVQ
jgi:streptogramin lyase